MRKLVKSTSHVQIGTSAVQAERASVTNGHANDGSRISAKNVGASGVVSNSQTSHH